MPRRSDFPIEALLGGKIAPRRQAERGMRAAEAELTARFHTHARSRQENARALAPVREALGETLRAPLQESAKELRATMNRYARQRLSVPKTAKLEQRIFTGSYGITRVPPYNYQWTWTAKDPSSTFTEVTANAGNGRMRFELDTNMDDGSHASCAAAVGIYVRPAIPNGFVHLTATPAFNYGWGTWSDFSSSHSDGWLGLYVGQYTLPGDQDHVPVDQQIGLWSDDSWWSGTGWHTASNSGYPLSAWFPVDSNHWYAMWVWCGGSVSADGWGTFSGSGAIASLTLAVPSMSVFVY